MLKKIFYTIIISAFFQENLIMAATIEDSAQGVKSVISKLQSLRNGELKTAVETTVQSITTDPNLTSEFQVVLLDALDALPKYLSIPTIVAGISLL